MTQEEKQLLLKDLCARLPHGVKVLDDMGRTYELQLGNAYLIDLFYGNGDYVEAPIRPYLRPISSMTKEEREEIKCRWVWTHNCWDENDIADIINRGMVEVCDTSSFIDWLISNHFDFRGLIPKGLALEALDGMYNKIIK